MQATRHSSRKFLITVIIILISTSLLVLNIITASNWVQVVEVIGATYIAGNVIHTAISRVSNVNIRNKGVNNVSKN